MKKFRDLAEAKDTIVFGFGRFNPPTTGHEKVIQKTVSVAGSNPYRIFPSHTQNPKKDPLPQALKTAYMRKMFKKYARNIVVTKSRNAIEIAVELYDQGYKNLVMVVGSDRVKVFDAMLKQYNGVEGKAHGYYKFDSIKIVSAGQRDPDAEGVEGMSASKMRAAAADGDMDSFLKGVPSGFADGKKLYRDVRKYMGIREERDMGDMTDFETIRDMYLTGKIWNAGDVVEANGISGEVVRKGTNYLSFVTEDGKVHKAWLYEVELGEDASVYKKTARKNKNDVTYAFGRTKKLDGQPKEKGGYWVWKLSQNYDGKVKGGIRSSWSYVAKDLSYSDAVKLMNKKLGRKEFKEEVELDEMSWYNELIAKISQMKHPTGYEKMAKAYAAKMREKEYKGKPGLAISDIAKLTKNIGPRQLAAYINKLVDKGIFPKELKAEYVPEMSFKDLVQQIQERELTDTEQKRREEIAKGMSDKDFKKKYGDRWKEVKMAVATNMAKKESLKT